MNKRVFSMEAAWHALSMQGLPPETIRMLVDNMITQDYRGEHADLLTDLDVKNLRMMKKNMKRS